MRYQVSADDTENLEKLKMGEGRGEDKLKLREAKFLRQVLPPRST